ncbi:DUF6919 domain-containing protein [Streptomyces violarus]|uniref:DUF6919 domain-containing protein n=1 Tax=Streptomyces violarus TaxID=67380 RepID=UPI0021BFA1F1|nr:hypothetical protein [Streptomyces violarus]MCT9142418.1 hypothetical protein [Streptomyces violarus]
MSRADRRVWKTATSVTDLADLMAQWLEGSIASWPGYQPGYGPDEETAHLVPSLAALNRAGFLTVTSQPGEAGTGFDGLWWEQRAAVEGFVTSRALYGRLLEAADRAGLLVAVHHDDGMHACGRALPVTLRDGKTYTTFGGRLSRRNMRHIWPGIRREAFDDLRDAVHLTIAAPEYGPAGERLWAELDFVTGLRQEDPTNPWSPVLPQMDDADTKPRCAVCGCTKNTPYCLGGWSVPSGSMDDLCSACAHNNQPTSEEN